MGLRVKKAHFLQRVAKKFQPYRSGIARGVQIKDVAAPGHFAGARDHGNALVPPLHRLLQQQLGGVIAALAKLQRARVEKIDRHVAQQQAFNTDHQHTRLAKGERIQRGKPGSP